MSDVDLKAELERLRNDYAVQGTVAEASGYV